MPVSKRDKKVSLTKTPKKGMKMKQELVETIRSTLESYNNLFVFTVHNMRNNLLKEVREEWKDSRFIFAKRKVMAIALGRTDAEEVKKNLHKVAVHLVGQCGLMFTNRPKDEVLQWFRDYTKMDFAKSGFVATENVVLPAGPLENFVFSMEPHLRSLGLPTQLEKGKIVLRQDHQVCSAGSPLRPEQATILKLIGKQMVEFKVTLVCVWSKDGSFEKFKVPKTQVTPKWKTIKKVEESPKPEAKTPKQLIVSVKANGKSPKPGTPKQSKDIFMQKEESDTQVVESPKPEVKTPKQQTPKQQTPKQLTGSVKANVKSPKPEAGTPKHSTDISKQREETNTQIVESLKSEVKTPKHQTPKQQTPKQLTGSVKANGKSPKVGTPKQSVATKEPSPTPMDTESEETTLDKKSPTPKRVLRRSIRTPKPIKRTPEQQKTSVKRLTSAKKTPKLAKGTPKQASNKKVKVFTPQKQSVSE